jgi:hypothetical protein
LLGKFVHGLTLLDDGQNLSGYGIHGDYLGASLWMAMASSSGGWWV